MLMLQKECEQCKDPFQVKDGKKGQARRFCGPICSRRWVANNRSAEWRSKASEAKKGKNNPMFGVKQANPNSLSNLNHDYWKGKSHSAESNEKRSKALKGRPLSEEHKRQISETKKANRKWQPDDPEYKEFKKYQRKVYYWTNKNDLATLENYDKRSKKGYHLDHRFSIYEGFLQNIPPKVIGNIHNLEMLPAKENMSKATKCSITKEELECLTVKP